MESRPGLHSDAGLDLILLRRQEDHVPVDGRSLQSKARFSSDVSGVVSNPRASPLLPRIESPLGRAADLTHGSPRFLSPPKCFPVDLPALGGTGQIRAREWRFACGFVSDACWHRQSKLCSRILAPDAQMQHDLRYRFGLIARMGEFFLVVLVLRRWYRCPQGLSAFPNTQSPGGLSRNALPTQ